MTSRITYFEGATLTHIDIYHAPDLSTINHESIKCGGKLALNDEGYRALQMWPGDLTVIKALKQDAQEVSELYFDLMVSGDVGAAVK